MMSKIPRIVIFFELSVTATIAYKLSLLQARGNVKKKFLFLE